MVNYQRETTLSYFGGLPVNWVKQHELETYVGNAQGITPAM